MVFHDIANRDWKELLPGVRIRSFWAERMMVCHVQLDAGAVVPWHSHPHEQGGVVISGEIEFTVDTETRRAVTGDSYIIPGGVQHTATAVTDTTLFEIFSPVRDEYK